MIDRSALEAAVAGAEAPELLALAGELQGRAWVRLSPTKPATAEILDPEQPQAISVDLPTAALLTGLPEDYLRVLTRQRRIPTVRPPSTKPGRGGKYVRVLVEDLRRFLLQNRDPGLDGVHIQKGYLRHDREGSEGAAKAARGHAARAGNTRGAALEHHREDGAGRGPDHQVTRHPLPVARTDG